MAGSVRGRGGTRPVVAPREEGQDEARDARGVVERELRQARVQRLVGGDRDDVRVAREEKRPPGVVDCRSRATFSVGSFLAMRTSMLRGRTEARIRHARTDRGARSLRRQRGALAQEAGGPASGTRHNGAMKTRDLTDLVLLGALWGASFLFMRVAAPAFGPVALIALRVALAAVVLMPLALAAGHGPELRRRAGAIAWVGVTNSAVPFVLFAFATLSLTAGFALRRSRAVGAR